MCAKTVARHLSSGDPMICFRCSREQLDRTQAPNGLSEEQAEAIGWRRVLDLEATEQKWLCPFCCTAPWEEDS